MPNPLDRRWDGETVAIIASGPSVDAGQVDLIRRSGMKAIAINRSFELAPWADVIYGCDFGFWKVYQQAIKRACPTSEFWTMDPAATERFQLNRIRGVDRPGFGTVCVHTGGNSGYQAINLCWIWGAKKVILVGYDMQPDPERGLHFFGAHKQPLVQYCLFKEWIQKYNTIPKDLGMDIINCSKVTALECFPRMDLQDAISIYNMDLATRSMPEDSSETLTA